MAYALLGILAIALLASFIVAFVSSKTWPIYQTVLVAFIALFAVIFFFLSAQTLSTHKNWRERYQQAQQQLENYESQLVTLRGGLSPDGRAVAGEVPELRHELAVITRERGGVFYSADVENIEDNVVSLKLNRDQRGTTEEGAGQPFPGQPQPGQAMPAQPLPGQADPGQPDPGQPDAVQPVPAEPATGQPIPDGQPVPSEPDAGVQTAPEEPAPIEPVPGGEAAPGVQPDPGQPATDQPFAPQAARGSFFRPVAFQPVPGEPDAGQPAPVQPTPDQPVQPVPPDAGQPGAAQPADGQPDPAQPGSPDAGLPAPVDPAAAQPPAGQGLPGPPGAAAGEEAASDFVHGLVPDTIVFAFEERPVSEGGRYLGEFKVVESEPGNPVVKLAPNLPLTEAQGEHLEAASDVPWTLYMSMPTDNPRVFAEMDADKRQSMLPPASAEEFANADRPLRDYHDLFHEHYVQSVLLRDYLAYLEGNIQRTTEATERVNATVSYRQSEQAKLQSDLEKFRFEAEAIAKYQKSLEQKLAEERERAKQQYIENRRAAAVLTRHQLELQRTINRQAGVAAANP
ncbi:MAG: hypothetical protein DWQ37_22235 [Planctomycetota bacterium]|nr:MAG: hypothetical protein DWQ37_22235 [Planctomycetota bacterium]